MLTFISSGLYDQAVKSLLAANMPDTALQLFTYLQGREEDLEPAIRQQLLTDCAKLMSDIDYKQGLDTMKNQMLDSEEFTKEEVASC